LTSYNNAMRDPGRGGVLKSLVLALNFLDGAKDNVAFKHRQTIDHAVLQSPGLKSVSAEDGCSDLSRGTKLAALTISASVAGWFIRPGCHGLLLLCGYGQEAQNER
jgi:hypothetical protein